MRIVVTGRQGQIVRSLIETAASTSYEVVPLGRPQLDLGEKPASIVHALDAASPDVIVSSAAYTAVDRAESEADLAFAINEIGARMVAEAAEGLGVPLIHISTDYVFDGTKAAPYVESDPPAPTSVYGASKLAGERAVLAAHADTIVLRTAWVYSAFGANFAKTMLRLACDREEIPVVADQVGTPTSASDIADAIFQIGSNLRANRSPELRGIFHMTAAGEASWADFAEVIFSASQAVNGPTARVRRISTAEYPTPAKRPQNSRLDCSKLGHLHAVRLPEWRASAAQVVRRLVRESASTKVSHA
jgi:dTDP-4-dehydrorhamnose reductase